MADNPSGIAPEERCVFAITEDRETLILGIPEAGWHYMKDGKTHTIDLRRFGIPVRIMMYGGTNRAELLKHLNISPDTLDLSGLDVGFGGSE